MVKIYAMSDLHGHLPQPTEVPDCAILILAGDIAPDFITSDLHGGVNVNVTKQAEWFDRQFKQFLNYHTKTKEVLWIGGNHDYALEAYPNLGPSLPGTYLCDDSVEVQGISFYGTPWVPHLRFWAFYADNDKLRDVYHAAAAAEPDILISHGPPYGFGDFCGPKWGKEEHVGYPMGEVLSLTNLKVPKAVVCGHIHEGAGIYRHSNQVTEVCNVAIRDAKYKVVRDATDISFVMKERNDR